jgi:hypothetical protein
VSRVEAFLRYLAGLLLALLTCAAAHADEQYEFAFWPTPASAAHPNFVRAQEGACGDLAVARVRTMPDALSSKIFVADAVYELGPANKVLRRWSLPANTLPVAVDGSELLFAEGDKYFGVNPKGKIRRRDLADRPELSTEAKCTLPPALRKSAFGRCHAFPRVGSAKKALLAFNGPCT